MAMALIQGYEYKPAAHLLVTDEDAADFLQSQFSNDLQPFESGRCNYGLWLDVKGKVVADSFILCEGGERFRLLSERSDAATIAGKLEQHIIADDVVVERLPEGFAIALVGDKASTVLESLGIPVPIAGEFTTKAGICVYGGRRSLEPCFEFWSESADRISDLKTGLIRAGVEFVATRQIELMRLKSGIPSIPQEIGPSDLPGEGGLVGNGVSLTKGCYLGQEVVARMHNVGRAQRALFLIEGSGTAPACPMDLYNGDSKKVGVVRSAFSTEGSWLGVALLKTRYARVGDLLEHESGRAKIVRLFQVTLNETTGKG